MIRNVEEKKREWLIQNSERKRGEEKVGDWAWAA
jgi:hypothetical protein